MTIAHNRSDLTVTRLKCPDTIWPMQQIGESLVGEGAEAAHVLAANPFFTRQ